MGQREHGAQPGDLIEITRPAGLYQHWAVYVGDDEVVHLTTGNQNSSSSSSSCSFSSSGSEAVVKRENIWKVVDHCCFKVNNLLDGKFKPRDPRVIVKEACEMVGKKVCYSAAVANCEHFVTELRYRIRWSGQAIKAVAAVGVGVSVFIATTAVAPATAAAAATYIAVSALFKKYTKEKK